jgi:carbonic anhydrase/acetyltransferase-like protein (isoleucine patch superfamily)
MIQTNADELQVVCDRLRAGPKIHDSCFVAKTAVVSGDVVLGAGSSVWYSSVLRGDVQPIWVGSNTNIQDLTVVHGSTGGQPTVIGDSVTVGHGAILHSCKLEDFAFIGFGARVLDGCVVESDGFLAAGAVLTPGKTVGTAELWAGNPARPVRRLTDEEVEMNRLIAQRYRELAAIHADAGLAGSSTAPLVKL